MVQSAVASSTNRPIPARLAALRKLMKERGIDAVIVRSTDRYLNEYVPSEESTREWITGFTGSMGDALITGDRAILVVDGRYTLQASTEAPELETHTITLGNNIESAWLKLLEQLPKQGVRTLGIETERVSQVLFDAVQKKALLLGLEVKPTVPSLVESVRAAAQNTQPHGVHALGDVWAIDAKLSGRTVKERLALGRPLLDDKKLTGLLVVALDEIAWITNLRGTHFAFQATFRASALVRRDDVVVALESATTPSAEPGVQFTDDLASTVPSGARVGYDSKNTPASIVEALKARGVELVEVDSPFASARTKKTAAELAHMVAAFERADDVVSGVQKWVCNEIAKKRKVTEADVAARTEAMFKASGAFGLSFKVISAAGKNGAVIHYSTPDADTPLVAGELFLLDTGAYYEGGYATDLTRTFLLGGPRTKAKKEQRRLFTLVLQGAIAGMTARIPVGSVGEQLDALVRQPLWRAGLDYGHGTGHGVGVNVHESPPRVSIGSRVPIEVGQVFSIEPGVYLPDWGGVRIENLCTLVDDTEPQRNGVPRKFVRVQPLTFSPIDMRLVERSMLTAHEKHFLTWFNARALRRVKRTPKNALPPLR
jgi:Xaa-Pro aminopeptidase